MNELLSLCRSTTLQQRTFSLQLLGRILQRTKLNEYWRETVEGSSDSSHESVLEQLLAAEVPLLLRYALDENVGSVMFVAASALHSLLVTPLENVSVCVCTVCVCVCAVCV